jgi:protein gp37
MGDAPHRFPAVYDREGVIKISSNPKRPGLTYVPSARVLKSERRSRNILEHHDDGTLTVSLGKGPQWTGEIRCLPWKLDEPLRRRKPTKYFVNSLADIFHEKLVGCEEGRRFIAAIFGVMEACPQHTFQILTKRDPRPWFDWLNSATLGHPRLLFQYLDDLAWEHPDIVIPQLQGRGDRRVPWPLPNVWLGQSVEDQAAADARTPWVLDTPAAVRWLSVEPMLGPIVLPADFLALGSRAWVVCGGESGPGARPMHPDWARSLRDQCVVAGVPFLYKQGGAWMEVPSDDPGWTHMVTLDGRAFARREDVPLEHIAHSCAYMRRVGKKASGRELDGRTWDEYPPG